MGVCLETYFDYFCDAAVPLANARSMLVITSAATARMLLSPSSGVP
jgi:hypothetical protein